MSIRIYNLHGEFTAEPNILDKDIFRKMSKNGKEKKICEILMKHPHNNIVKIHDVTNNYIEMELLNTSINPEDIVNIENVMIEVKTYLHSLGIMYIDWKLDNIGIGDDGQYKLFDFDTSGIIDIKTNEWIIDPPEYWSYNEAIKNGMESPVDIDNYAFTLINRI